MFLVEAKKQGQVTGNPTGQNLLNAEGGGAAPTAGEWGFPEVVAGSESIRTKQGQWEPDVIRVGGSCRGRYFPFPSKLRLGEGEREKPAVASSAPPPLYLHLWPSVASGA